MNHDPEYIKVSREKLLQHVTKITLGIGDAIKTVNKSSAYATQQIAILKSLGVAMTATEQIFAMLKAAEEMVSDSAPIRSTETETPL